MRVLTFFGILLVVGCWVLTEAYPGRRNNRRSRWGNRKNKRVDANTGGTATGEQSNVETESTANVDYWGRGNANTRGSGRAWGSGKSTLDLESFAAGGENSGAAGTGGGATGDQSSVNSESVVNVDQAKGDSFSYTSGSAGASGRGVSAVDLESFAELDDNQGSGTAGAKAIGRDATSVAGAIAVKAEEDNVRAGSAGSASAVGEGRVGSQSHAGVTGENSGLGLSSKGLGEGQQVASGSESRAALSGGTNTGGSSSFARVSSKDGRGSVAESGARLETGGK